MMSVAESSIQKILIGDYRNRERPLDAVELFRLVARYLERMYYAEKQTASPAAPFLINDIELDLAAGVATVSLHRQVGEAAAEGSP